MLEEYVPTDRFGSITGNTSIFQGTCEETFNVSLFEAGLFSPNLWKVLHSHGSIKPALRKKSRPGTIYAQPHQWPKVWRVASV